MNAADVLNMNQYDTTDSQAYLSERSYLQGDSILHTILQLSRTAISRASLFFEKGEMEGGTDSF